ncbi:MAG: hypothetical protein AB198_00465 [Parcubacteria bacterium C7867-003]|nr:MAG: hypothetical protein AB198_00465 [Parcubacteria bacterium C7867-003]
MTIAQIRQWVRVIPLSVRLRIEDRLEDLREKLREIEILKVIRNLFMNRGEKIAQAMQKAQSISDAGRLMYESNQHVGFIRIWVTIGEGKRQKTHVLDFRHEIHWRGERSRMPTFIPMGKIRFVVRTSPLPYSDPTETSSYLEILN